MSRNAALGWGGEAQAVTAKLPATSKRLVQGRVGDLRSPGPTAQEERPHDHQHLRLVLRMLLPQPLCCVFAA